MKILTVSGNQNRHLYFVNAIHASVPLTGAVLQIRKDQMPSPPQGLCELDQKNFILHFQKREQAEQHHFQKQSKPNCPTLEVTGDELNSNKVMEFIKSIQPDIVLIFGSNLIKGELFQQLPEQTVNFHLGLSPRYRGAATMFWPFYFLEPTYAGATFHYIVDEPDAGNMIHQVVPPLDRSDGIHDVSCKTVIQSTKEMAELLSIYQKEGRWKFHTQKSSGKNFLASDFKPSHLRVIYTLFQDDIVCRYLDGEIESRKPFLFRQF